jgi:hypothetical protein
LPANGLAAASALAGAKSVDARGRTAVAAAPRKNDLLVSFGMIALLFSIPTPSRMRAASHRSLAWKVCNFSVYSDAQVNGKKIFLFDRIPKICTTAT